VAKSYSPPRRQERQEDFSENEVEPICEEPANKQSVSKHHDQSDQ
jgi:hypothetical protein